MKVIAKGTIGNPFQGVPRYEVIRDDRQPASRRWGFTTPAGVIWRPTKRSAQNAADAWAKANQEAA